MRGVRVVVMLACGCGRVGFDDGDVRTADARPDANVCLSQTYDIPSWPIPNDPQSGLPNIASRTPVTSDRIVDAITGLEWQRDEGPMSTFADAVAYCASLDIDGGCWRVPERLELQSIVNYALHSPSADPMFTSTPIADFWSHTPFASDPTHRWSLRFDVGYILDLAESSLAHVRCVRGAQDTTSTRFQIDTETVRDLRTGLEWQRVIDGTYMWAAARDYCANLALAGGGWRSPSVQELTSLVDSARTDSPVIDEVAFPNTPSSMFWSGNEIQNNATNGWTIDFSEGFSFRPITTELPTRCVR